MTGRIVQINVSPGGVPKRAVPVARVTPAGIAGDGHRHRALHGGPDRALCLYSIERIDALRADGHPIEPGALGENLTIAGLDWPRVRPDGAPRRHGRATAVWRLRHARLPLADGAPRPTLPG